MKLILLSILAASVFLAVEGQRSTPKFEIDVGRHKNLQEFGEKVRKACTDWYRRVAQYMSTPGYKDPTSILIRFDPNYDGVAYAEWHIRRITGSTKYYRENPNDVGSMIHEMAHIIQEYRNGCPGWFTEGLADYVRYFQYEPKKAPGKPRGGSYRDGYGTTAYFLNYVSEKVKGGRQAVLAAHKGCREGSYKESVWQEFTGKSPDALWNDMQRS